MLPRAGIGSTARVRPETETVARLSKSILTTSTMSLSLSQLSLSIKCDENELETFDAKRESPSLISAFVASEAGKVGCFTLRLKSAFVHE